MRDRDWLQLFFHALRDERFELAVLAHLTSIRDARYEDRLATIASFGGFLRCQRSYVRLQLAAAVMEQLHIPPTLHVAKHVMNKTFGQAAANDTLDRRFAEPGRDATEKHMDLARQILFMRPDQVDRYGRLYDWYCRALKRAVKRLKRRC